VDLTLEPAVVTVGQFDAGVRNNIIPERARLVGTIRTFNNAMRAQIHRRVREIAEKVADAHGAKAKVRIESGYPAAANDPSLMDAALPTLKRLKPDATFEATKLTGSEDFSFYAMKVPAVFLFLGITEASKLDTCDSNHSPRFEIDESALPTGARLLAHLAIDYLSR
jgi:amidohydrolase